MTKTGWMVVVSCPCTPDEMIAYTQKEMGRANLGHCPSCLRPLVIVGDDGKVYAVGECLIKDAYS